MSEFAAESFDSKFYDLNRPSYPPKFFNYIIEKCVPAKSESFTIVDIGTGPGTAIATLIDMLTEKRKTKAIEIEDITIWATDCSQVMINQAKNKLNNYTNDINLKFAVCKGEEIDTVVKHADLLLAAECVHWLDTEKWLESVKKVCDGYLVYWGYVDPVFIDKPDMNAFYENFVYENNDFAKCWSQPGRSILRSSFRNINERMEKEFTDCEIVYRDPSSGIGEDSILRIENVMKVSQFLSYVDTWSSSFTWNSNHSPEEKASVLFYEGFQNHGLNFDDLIKTEMKTVYCIIKL